MTPDAPRPHLTINGLNALALKIALFMHASSGMLRMQTVEHVAVDSRLLDLLPGALLQLKEFELAEVCPWCDCLVSIHGCDGKWCELHKGRASVLGHEPGCPRALRKTPSSSAAAERRARA